jgi:hypothetical protein
MENALFDCLDTFVAMLSRSAVSVMHKAARLLLTAQTVLSFLLVLEQRNSFAMP